MGDLGSQGSVLVLSRSWEQESEAAFVMRHIAAALGRSRPVDICVPGPVGAMHADGAFDLVRLGGTAADGEWPSGEIPSPPDPPSVVMVEAGDMVGASAARRKYDSIPIVAVGGIDTAAHADYTFSVIPTTAATTPADSHMVTVGMHVPINPLASTRRHNGLGFVGYVLVLGAVEATSIESTIGWLAASMTRTPVVAISDAVASVYRTRALIGRVGVDTRTDLWRLMAFASVVIDLAPGPLLGRECIEAQRLGTPTIAPAHSTGALIGAAGGGLWFRDVAELLACVDTIRHDEVGDALRARGLESTDRWFGDPVAWVRRVSEACDFVISDFAESAERPTERLAEQLSEQTP